MTSHDKDIKLKTSEEIKLEKESNKLPKNIKAIALGDKVVLFKLFLGRWIQLSAKEEENVWYLIRQL